MDFKTWIIDKQRRKDGTFRDSRFGDLAQDISADRTFPENADRDRIECHLRVKGACRQCLETFRDAWRKYRKECKGDA